MQSYNGFTKEQRAKKQSYYRKFLKSGLIKKPVGKCMMCGDSKNKVVYHDEDYGEPFDENSWSPPKCYILCRTCHDRIHKRFASPERWKAYIAHIRRGGYGKDLKIYQINKEYKKKIEAIQKNIDFKLPILRSYHLADKLPNEWFAKLAIK